MPEVEPRIRPPQQRRSQASLDRVLDAGTELLQERGWGGFTLAEVSRRANVSIGSIYARVPSKEALLYTIYDRYSDRLRAEQVEFEDPERFRGLPTEELVHAAIRAFAETMHQHRRMLSVMMHRGAVDAAIATRGSASSSAVGQSFKDLLLTRRDEIRHSNPELAVDVAWRIVYCALARQVMYGPTFESDRNIKWDQLVAELARACSAYLLDEAVAGAPAAC
jgi:AcrR family transcriptional regulator